MQNDSPLEPAPSAFGSTNRVPGAAEARQAILPVAEELFRSIYTRAGFGMGEIVAVCSAIAGEGKSMLCLGLALTYAQDFPDKRVLLIEAELQRPVLAEDFELNPAPGLTEVLHGLEPLESALRASYLENLDLLPAGVAGTRPGRILRSGRMATVLDSLRQGYDLIILDTPALLANSDALILSDLADGIVVVVRAGATPTSLINKAIEQLDESKLRGVVVNSSQRATPDWVRRVVGS